GRRSAVQGKGILRPSSVDRGSGESKSAIARDLPVAPGSGRAEQPGHGRCRAGTPCSSPPPRSVGAGLEDGPGAPPSPPGGGAAVGQGPLRRRSGTRPPARRGESDSRGSGGRGRSSREGAGASRPDRQQARPAGDQEQEPGLPPGAGTGARGGSTLPAGDAGQRSRPVVRGG